MRIWIGLAGGLWTALALAAQVADFSPQGSVKDVRQAAARFDLM